MRPSSPLLHGPLLALLALAPSPLFGETDEKYSGSLQEPAPRPTIIGSPPPDIGAALAATIKDAVPSSHYSHRLASLCLKLYEANDFQPIWAGRTLSETLLVHLAHQGFEEFQLFDDKPLHLTDFPPELAHLAPGDLIETLTLLDAGFRVRHGVCPPAKIWPDWNEGDKPGDISAGDEVERLAGALKNVFLAGAPDSEAVIRVFEPKNWVYQGLREQWLTSRITLDARMAEYVAIPPLRPKQIVRSGDAYEHAGLLEARLRSAGYLDPGVPASNLKPTSISQGANAPTPLFTEALAKALKEFQKDHGLKDDGVLGPSTWNALDTDPRKRLDLIELNLHRARILPDDLGERHLLVNIPAAEVYGYKNREHAFTMKVVVGKAAKDQHTPVFRDIMRYVVFRPYWNIPSSIAKEEIVEETKKDPQSFYRKGYEIVSGYDSSPLEPTWENLELVRQGRLQLRQRPGSGNALGTVKFLFPNSFHVYMHDTPQSWLFSHSRRDYSHGCIRLAKPDDMALFALGDQGWTLEKIRSARNAGGRESKTIEKPINVYVTYFTAFPAPQLGNKLGIYNDLYAQDEEDARLIAEARGQAAPGTDGE